MGREAECRCAWNGKAERVKALLEPPELILRGAVRRRIPFSAMRKIRADNGNLCFQFGQDEARLALGELMAARWAQAMLAPAATLAKKLGVIAGSTVRTMGRMDDDALLDALRDARSVMRGKAGVIVARVDSRAELEGAFEKTVDLVKNGSALWIVYRKGSGHAIGESDVRATGLAAGVVDVKVASVSPQLTALKFVRRKAVPFR
jgi:hypothetical protein